VSRRAADASGAYNNEKRFQLCKVKSASHERLPIDRRKPAVVKPYTILGSMKLLSIIKGPDLRTLGMYASVKTLFCICSLLKKG
jgi:hypothetical protein